MKLCLISFCLLLFGCKGPGITENGNIPVVSLIPSKVQPFVASTFFDGYRVLTFKDMICTEIGDFVDVRNKIVASSVVKQGLTDSITICVFDTEGHYLYPLGTVGRGPGEYQYISKDIELTRDTTVLMKSTIGWVEYDVDGHLVKEERMMNPMYDVLGFMRWKMNDSTLLFQQSVYGRDVCKEDRILQVVSLNDFHLKRSFLPLWPSKEYAALNHFYVQADTTCFYLDFEGRVYTVLEDTVLVRYVLDKGEFSRLTSFEMLKRKKSKLPNSLQLINLAENSRYLIGKYLLNEQYYFFFYDKRLRKTINLKAELEDDLLFGKIPKLFFYWEPGIRISDDYMYFYFTPHRYSRLIEDVRKRLNEAEWEAYQQKHPDILKIYDELDDNSNTVVIGYHFK